MDRRLPPATTKRVRDLFEDDLDGLLAAGEAVESLLAHPGWLLLTKLADAEAVALEDQMDNAHEPLPQADYAQRHGRRGGLTFMATAALAVQRVAADQHAKALASINRGAGAPRGE